MKNVTKGRILKTSALVIDVVSPLVATISLFPVWIEKSASATISGLFLVLTFLSCVPFLKNIKAWLKSPSVPVMWLVFFGLFVLLRNIIDQMTIVCLVGAISNFVGTGIYKLGEIIEARHDKEEGVNG